LKINNQIKQGTIMKKVTIEGNILIVENKPFPTYRFEIVESVDRSYHVWQIGKNMAEGYTPYCQMLDNVRVNTETLKTVKNK
jgi:hypothetical protein